LLRTIREATGITLAVETVEPEPISVPFDEEDADDEAVLGV
jgi:hypothetical protein